MPLTPKRFSRALLLIASMLAASQSHAICALCVCTVTTTSLVFAAHNPLVASNNDSSGNVRVSCGGVASIGLTYSVALSAGVNGTMAVRKMASGANRLNYNVYTSSGYSTVWGDGTGATQMVNGSVALDVLGLSPPQDWPVYGRIPGGQSGVAPGTYADTLIVTLTYN
jgi:spore coat protein U-like protein